MEHPGPRAAITVYDSGRVRESPAVVDAPVDYLAALADEAAVEHVGPTARRRATSDRAAVRAAV